MFPSKALDRVAFWLNTLYLFTKSDYKTFFFPVMISACAVSPPTKVTQLFGMAIWVWFHLLQFNVSSQSYSAHEDIVNKPWRPLPSGRISVEKSQRLRWALLIICLCLSAWHGTGVVVSSVALTLMEIIYEDVGFSSDPVLKNVMNVGGYLTVESGAAMIISSTSFDQTSFIALLVSGLLILTTIHAQDFADTEGDKRSSRRTLPIIAPEGSRLSMLTVLPLWSIVLSVLWGLGPLSTVVFLYMGAFVGSRYFRLRDTKDDKGSFVLYTV